MVDKVIFMPFDPKHSGYLAAQYEYGRIPGGLDKNQQEIDREFTKGNRAVQVWWGKTGVWWRLGHKDPFLASMQDGQIYIRGHGMAGNTVIEGGRGGEKVSYKTVVDRLIDAGLSKTFRGKIKCFNCHSAEADDDQGRAAGYFAGVPFAQLIADELYSRGYKKCTVYGYTGRIDSFAKDGSAGKHKYVREYRNGAMVEAGRASQSRTPFPPRMGHALLASAAALGSSPGNSA